MTDTDAMNDSTVFDTLVHEVFHKQAVADAMDAFVDNLDEYPDAGDTIYTTRDLDALRRQLRGEPDDATVTLDEAVARLRDTARLGLLETHEDGALCDGDPFITPPKGRVFVTAGDVVSVDVHVDLPATADPGTDDFENVELGVVDGLYAELARVNEQAKQ